MPEDLGTFPKRPFRLHSTLVGEKLQFLSQNKIMKYIDEDRYD
jgi:hypothetical protein